METARLTSWLRACNVSVLLLSAIYWFSDDPINGMRITYWLLLALPWLAALFMPSGKVKIAAGLVLAGSGVLAPIIVLFQVLAPPGSHRSGTDWLLCWSRWGPHPSLPLSWSLRLPYIAGMILLP